MGKLCCQICGGDIVFDGGTKGGTCSRCGLSYSHQDLRSLGLQGQAPASPAPPSSDADHAQVDVDAVQQPCGEGTCSAAEGSSEGARIGWWRTNIGLSIAGALAICAFNALPYLGDFAPWLGIVDWVLAIALAMGTLLYALRVYPSYFGSQPKLTSSAKVSFLNCFLGGPLFGCLWNRSLTRGKKGVSHIVMSVLTSLTLALGVLMLAAELAPSPEERMFERITRPGEMLDETTWVSEPIYPDIVNDNPSSVFIYWDVFNNDACWILSDATGRPYDELHQAGDGVKSTRKEVVLEGAQRQSGYAMQASGGSRGEPLVECAVYQRPNSPGQGNTPRRQSQNCSKSSSHVVTYDYVFQVDGVQCRMEMMQLYEHEAGTQYPAGHKGARVPWYVFISVEGYA